jgi:hypothetical protein
VSACWASAPSAAAPSKVLTRNQQEITRRAGRRSRSPRVADLDVDAGPRVVGGRARSPSDAREVVTDPDIDIVVELIGGYGIAKELVLARSKTASTWSPPTRRCWPCTATRSSPPPRARA